MEVAFSASFKRAFAKRIKGNKTLEQKFWNRTEVFINNPFHHPLKTHKLTGELRGEWSFWIEYDCRVIFYFESKSKSVFTDIGSHDEVY